MLREDFDEAQRPLDRNSALDGFWDGARVTSRRAAAGCILADPPAPARDQRRDGLTSDRPQSSRPLLQPSTGRAARRSRREGGDLVNVIAQEEAVVSEARLRRREAAEVRIEAALVCLEEAQRLIDEAARAVCGVKGMAVEWRRLGSLHDRVKRAWYGLRGRSDSLSLTGRLLLDHEPDHYEEHWRAL